MRRHLQSNLFAGALAVVCVTGLCVTGCTQEDPATQLQAANTALTKGEVKTAQVHLKNLLQKHETDAAARLLLARTYAASQDWALADKEFRRALALGADRSQAVPGEMEAKFHVGDSNGLIERSAGTNLDDPKAQALVHFWTARTWMRKGDTVKARVAFEDALRSNPSLVKAKVGLLGLQARAGAEGRTGALAALDVLLHEVPDSHEALMLQAELRFASGDIKGARIPVQAAIANSPSDLHARSTLVEIDLALRDRDSVRTQLAELLKRAPRWPVARTQMAQLNLLEGNAEAARTDALEALKAAPEYPPALAIVGAVMLAQDRLEQAEAYARRLVKVAPELANGHRLLAATLLKRGEAGRALQVVEPLLDSGVQDAHLLVIAGEAALSNGDAGASARYFAKAADLDQQDPGKRIRLALARIQSGDRAAALADLQTASYLTKESSVADRILVAALISERQFDHALRAVARLENKQPNSGDVPYLRGRVALAAGDMAQARRYFEQAASVDPSMLHVAASLAALDVKEGKVADARRRFATLVEADPKSIPALLGLARVNAETGAAPQEVLSLLRRARDADPGSQEAVLILARGLVAQGQPQEAVQALQDASTLHPGRAALLGALAEAHIKAGEPERSKEVIDRLVRLRPNDRAIQFRMGQLKAALDDHAGALERYRRARTLQPEATEPRISIALTQVHLGRFDEATITATELKKDFPGNPAGWALEGEVQRARQQWPVAAAAFQKAWKIDPSARVNAFKLHDSLVRAGKTEEAARLLQELLKASPSDEKLNLYVGERELAGKRFTEAVRHYEIAIAANPANAAAHNNLAWSLHQLRNDKALAIAERAYRMAPNSAAIADTLATILSDTRQTGPAIEMHKRAATLAPSSADLRLKFAHALKNSGRKSEARGELDGVVRDFPGTAHAIAANRLKADL